MSQPGDRCPGFMVEPLRCSAMIYDHNMQASHCYEQTRYSCFLRD